MPGRAFSITGNMGGTGIQLRPGADFPGGPVVKNPPSNAGGTGSIPGRGAEIPHASGQLTQPKINNVNKYFFKRPGATEIGLPARCVSTQASPGASTLLTSPELPESTVGMVLAPKGLRVCWEAGGNLRKENDKCNKSYT